MRWDTQAPTATDDAALPGLTRIAGLVRSVEAPEFAGVTFHEVLAKSALNRVPDASSMPFRWTVNPWRGYTHACAYLREMRWPCHVPQYTMLPRARPCAEPG